MGDRASQACGLTLLCSTGAVGSEGDGDDRQTVCERSDRGPPAGVADDEVASWQQRTQRYVVFDSDVAWLLTERCGIEPGCGSDDDIDVEFSYFANEAFEESVPTIHDGAEPDVDHTPATELIHPGGHVSVSAGGVERFRAKQLACWRMERGRDACRRGGHGSRYRSPPIHAETSLG